MRLLLATFLAMLPCTTCLCLPQRPDSSQVLSGTVGCAIRMCSSQWLYVSCHLGASNHGNRWKLHPREGIPDSSCIRILSAEIDSRLFLHADSISAEIKPLNPYSLPRGSLPASSLGSLSKLLLSLLPPHRTHSDSDGCPLQLGGPSKASSRSHLDTHKPHGPFSIPAMLKTLSPSRPFANTAPLPGKHLPFPFTNLPTPAQPRDVR